MTPGLRRGKLGTWLGLDWLRVEMDRRMYEPQKGQFDWDNEEMRTLYRSLVVFSAYDRKPEAPGVIAE